MTKACASKSFDVLSREIITSGSNARPDVLDAFVRKSKRVSEDWTARLLNAGYAPALKAHVEKNGLALIEKTNDCWDSALICLGFFDLANYMECLAVIRPALNEPAHPWEDTLHLAARAFDRPELIDPAMDYLGISEKRRSKALLRSTLTLEPSPAVRSWLVSRAADRLRPQMLDRSDVVERAGQALMQDDVHCLALLVKLGHDLREIFDNQRLDLENDAWHNRFASRMQSPHEYIEMVARLPCVEDVAQMDATRLKILMCGMSKREARQYYWTIRASRNKEIHTAA